jgi:hypothetical protein
MNHDRTFCASATHKPDCDRQITPDVEAAMKRANKQWVSMAYFCGEPELEKGQSDE